MLIKVLKVSGKIEVCVTGRINDCSIKMERKYCPPGF